MSDATGTIFDEQPQQPQPQASPAPASTAAATGTIFDQAPTPQAQPQSASAPTPFKGGQDVLAQQGIHTTAPGVLPHVDMNPPKMGVKDTLYHWTGPNGFLNTLAKAREGAEDIKNVIQQKAADLPDDAEYLGGDYVNAAIESKTGVPASQLAKAYKNFVAPAGEQASDFLGSQYTPTQLAMMGGFSLIPTTSVAGKLAHTAIGSYFAGKMGVESVKSAYDAYVNATHGNIPEATKAAFDALFNGAFAIEGGKGAAETGGKAVKEAVGKKIANSDYVKQRTPTSQTVAGVTAPIAPEKSTKAEYNEFTKQNTVPAALKQVTNTLGQSAHDTINELNAIRDGKPAPDKVTGTDKVVPYNTVDDIVSGLKKATQPTYDKADEIDQRERAEYQRQHEHAVGEHRDMINSRNESISRLNDPNNPYAGQERMDYLEFNPEEANVPEKPKFFSDLQSDLKTAKANTGSPDPAVRSKAFDTDVPKAEKAIDQWFKDHESEISPQEYQATKNAFRVSERYQEIANKLRLSTKAAAEGQASMTGNSLRRIETSMDNWALKKGQGKDYFKKLLGDEGYENWQKVAKVLDPRPEDTKDPGSFSRLLGKFALGVASHAVPGGMAAKTATHFIINHAVADPKFGDWFARSFDRYKGNGTITPAQQQEFTDLMHTTRMTNDELKEMGYTQQQIDNGDHLPRVGGGAPSATEQEEQKSTEPKYVNQGSGFHEITSPGENGYLLAQDIKPGEAQIKSHWVDEGTRGQGIGSNQIRTLAENLRQQGYEALHSDDEMTDAARGTWDKLMREHPQEIKKDGNNYRWDLKQQVGTTEGAQADTDHFAQAKKNLPNGTLSEQLREAQRLKESGNQQNSPASESADDYNVARGRGEIKPVVPATHPEAKEIADAYSNLEHNPTDPEVKKSYDSLKSDIDDQWNHAVEGGFKFEPWTGEGQPYASSKEMKADVDNNHHLFFFKGGEMPADHPLAETDPKTGLTYNDKFRAIHDLYGHAANGSEFGAKGEEAAYKTHAQMFSPDSIPALTTETRGQNNWVNAGPHMRDAEGNLLKKGDEGYLPPTERPYAEQKAGILPAQFHGEGTSAQGIADWHNAHRGFTWNPERGFVRDQKVFSVGMPDAPSQVFPKEKLTAADVQNFIGRPDVQRALQDPRASVGGWNHKGKAQLEVSRTYDDRDEAVEAGKRLNQTSIYDHANRAEIPTGGTAGDTAREPLKVVHYSDADNLSELDPQYYGQNMQDEINGQSLNRPDIARRNSFPEYWQNEVYMGQPTDTFMKRGERFQTRANKYEADLDPSRYYDMVNDPQGIKDQVRQELAAQNKERYGVNLPPSEQQVDAAAIRKLKDMGFAGRRDVNDLIASWEKVPVKKVGDNSASELPTRYPKGKNATSAVNADQHVDMAAMQEASRLAPTRNTGAGNTVMGYDEKMARTVADYPGMKLSKTELKDPHKVMSKFIDHVADNLEWLYNAMPEQLRTSAKTWYDSANNIVSDFANKHGVTPEQAAGVTAVLSPSNAWDNNVNLTRRMLQTWSENQNTKTTPEMEKEIIDLGTQYPQFKPLLKQLGGKTLSEVSNEDPDTQAVLKGLWIRMFDQAHNDSGNDLYSPNGDIVAKGAGNVAWQGNNALSKAVNILSNPSLENINANLGQGHKVRNFYNNMINPNSPKGHVTIDTHAVSAGLLTPMANDSLWASQNFGGSVKGTPRAPGSDPTGLKGTYPLYAEAYRRVAAKLGIKPRELQSIVWEGAKSLMQDKKTPDMQRDILDVWDRVKKGRLTPDKARAMILDRTGGFSKPEWMSDEDWERAGDQGGGDADFTFGANEASR